MTQLLDKEGSITPNMSFLDKGKVIDIEKYFSYLLQLLIQFSGSDLYITYGESPSIRIMGEIHRISKLPVFDDKILEGVTNILMNEQDDQLFQKYLSCDIGYSLLGRRFRINISSQRGHKMVVIRLLELEVPTIDGLKLPKIFKTMTQKVSGIIFVAGPTGSGKSTTLAAMIEEINNTRPCHVITIEDPIEYVFTPKKALIDQKQLGKDVVSFASAMKYALRQRPDVILFGEARDSESLRNAMALAETGHLVLTTIHSRSAEQTINKIISMFAPEEQSAIRNQLSENMLAIVIQRLLKVQNSDKQVTAHEILLNNVAVGNTIREDKLNQLRNVVYTNRTLGMQLLEDDLFRLVNEGKISQENALFHANDREGLKKSFERLGL